MSKTLCFAIQKGGCSKTTTTGIVTHMLAKAGKKVLAVDMDCQGNLTELLTGKSANEFEDVTVREAIRDMDASRYIYPVSENVDILPANNLLAILPRDLYLNYGFESNKVYTALRSILDPFKDYYDYVVIDTPPSLSEHTMNAFVAADHIVVMFESSQWCYSAIPNFMDSIEVAKRLNPNLTIAGILRTLNDVRRYDAKAFNELIGEDYPELVFQTVIKRKAQTGRLAINGFDGNSELKDATDQFGDFYKELIERVG